MGRTEAVIVATARTPMGRYGGQLKDLRPDDLAAIILQEACDRAHVKPGEVEDVILGCANQAGEDNRNVARVAQKYEVSREDQDAFALRSHQRAVAAQKAGRLAEEIVPVTVPQRKGEALSLRDDEGPRSDTSLESLGRLKPAFAENGSVTAGNASPLNDGATALVLMSDTKARERGLRPLARLVSAAPAGVHPDYMGIGPVPASLKALEKAVLQPSDIAVVELNEAFASQSLACIRLLGLDEEKVNVNGGAIALGHPLGSSGARLVRTLVREMEHRDAEYGLATMCIGVGQGIASIWQKI